MTRDDRSVVKCSFCGKSQREVRRIIAGPTVYICDECIALCNDIVDEHVAGEHAAKPATPGRVYALTTAAAHLAVGARRLADSCDRAVELPRPVAERARALAEEVELFATANASSRAVLLEYAQGVADLSLRFARACDALELPGQIAQRARTLSDEIKTFFSLRSTADDL